MSSVCATGVRPAVQADSVQVKVRDQRVAFIGHSASDSRVQRTLQKLADARTGLYAFLDEVGTGKIKRSDAIGLVVSKQLAHDLAHAFDVFDIVEARRGLAQRIGALEVEQLAHSGAPY